MVAELLQAGHMVVATDLNVKGMDAVSVLPPPPLAPNAATRC